MGLSQPGVNNVPEPVKRNRPNTFQEGWDDAISNVHARSDHKDYIQGYQSGLDDLYTAGDEMNLDELSIKYTNVYSLTELCDRNFPPIFQISTSDDPNLLRLADAYDAFQIKRDNPKRCHRI